MHERNPIDRSKEEYTDIVQRISLKDSPVGIDAQYTHAIIITYLQNILSRIERLEKTFKENTEKL